MTIGHTNVGGDIPIQGPRDSASIAEVDSHNGRRPNRLPDRLEGMIDEISNLVVGEQHGSRKSRVRSGEPLIEPANHLKQQHRFSRNLGRRASLFEIGMPADLARGDCGVLELGRRRCRRSW